MTVGRRAHPYQPDDDWLLYHNLFVDLLRSAIERSGESYAVIASRCGRSKRHIYYLLEKRSLPSDETLDRIIGGLPHLTKLEARRLKEFAQSARQKDPPLRRSTRFVLGTEEVAAELARLLDAHHAVLHDLTSTADYVGFQAVQADTARVLHRVRDPLADPATTARLQILCCNLFNYLDDGGNALKAARAARLILDVHATRTRRTPPELEALWVESVRAEAMTFHNLGLDDRALTLHQEADHALAARPLDPQRTYVALSRISALIRTRRFRIREIQELADQARHAVDRGAFSALESGLIVFQADQGVLNGYIRHRDFRGNRTERLLHDQLRQIERVEFAGPIHRVQLYRVAASYYAARNEPECRDGFLGRALQTAAAAGLDHQARRLEAELLRPTVVADNASN